MIYIGFLIRWFDRLSVLGCQVYLSGTSYKMVTDRLPVLGCQVYLSRFQAVG